MKNPRGRPKKHNKIVRISLSISKEAHEAIKWLKDGKNFRFSKSFNVSKFLSKHVLDFKNSKIKV